MGNRDATVTRNDVEQLEALGSRVSYYSVYLLNNCLATVSANFDISFSEDVFEVFFESLKTSEYLSRKFLLQSVSTFPREFVLRK